MRTESDEEKQEESESKPNTMKVRFAPHSETGVDLRRSASMNTCKKMQEFALLSFLIVESRAWIIRVISKPTAATRLVSGSTIQGILRTKTYVVTFVYKKVYRAFSAVA